MRKTYTKVLGGLAATALLFSGCAGGSSLSAAPAQEEARPAIAASKFKQIIMPAIFKNLGTADKELKAEDFAGRVSGPLAVERQAHYRLKALLGESYKMPELSDSADSLAISGHKFPRNAVAIVNWAKNKTTQGIDIFVQQQARDNWSLWAGTDILPGAKLPKIPAGEKGAESINHDDAAGLVASPVAVRDAYIGVLNGHETDGFVFTSSSNPQEPDTVRKELANVFQGYTNGVQGVGTAEQAFAAADTGVQTLRTEDGGALVVFQVNQTIRLTVTAQGGKMTVKDARIASLATGSANSEVEVKRQININAAFTMGLYVPAQGAQATNITAISASNPVITDVQNSQ